MGSAGVEDDQRRRAWRECVVRRPTGKDCAARTGAASELCAAAGLYLLFRFGVAGPSCIPACALHDIQKKNGRHSILKLDLYSCPSILGGKLLTLCKGGIQCLLHIRRFACKPPRAAHTGRIRVAPWVRCSPRYRPSGPFAMMRSHRSRKRRCATRRRTCG